MVRQEAQHPIEHEPALDRPIWARRPSRRTMIRVGIAAALVIVSLLTNRSYLGWGLFVIFAVLFVPVSRVRSFALAFVPYAGVWFIFTALRSLADETVLAQTLNTHVAAVERWLFGGELPTITLQASWFDPTNLAWYDFFLTFIHWSYFIVPHAVAIRLWQRHPARFRHFLGAMTLLLTVGLFIYFLIPSNPPWLAPGAINSPAAATTQRVMEPVAAEIGGGLYAAGYKVVGESNPIAAMPSIHMAITFLLVWAVRGWHRIWWVMAWVYSGLMALALVYLGEHYVVDIAVGMLVTTYSWFAAGTWLSRVAPVLLKHWSARRTPTTRVPEARPLAPQ